ncbi:terpenoid synthase [Rhizopus microsporus var. microsporus]|uniref:Geranylgeranyl pyrophosphate synthase n=2 Tax=Rhizopus microsporus TaxID=58291 RepID=A0A2G4SME6_RHIZD|nr:geranylgeranyl pyrophosphate synthase [Rhizopus microsporus ATCC 52813]ORE07226.1 terpenoid synthase [Rhizopus microsporus var. microsporus]PHZ09944.1 geranylgeranyl pyrophosphate synthase [Rhizopus microsporus ATCC 52813]
MLTFTTTTNGLKNTVLSLERQQTGLESIEKPQEDILLEPFRYLCANPGKDIRSKMIEAFDAWLQVPKEDLKVITKVIEMLHSASLLIDDVEDDSVLRRGVPAAHHIYGVPQTINCANYVYFVALSELTKLNKPKMIDIYTEELINLHRGQGMELFWRDTLTCPTEKEFLNMVNDKTGGLLRLAVKLMQEASQSTVDYTGLVSKIGIHFQVRDDYMNLQSKQYADNKGFCEDLTEGKFSFPIIHSIRTDPSNRQLLNILKQRSNSVELKQFALQLLEKTNTFAYCRRFLSVLEKEARNEIASLGGNKTLERILDALSVKEEENDAILFSSI